MQYEVEKRAILNKLQLDSIKSFLSKSAKVKKEYTRFTFVYLHRHDFQSDPNYPIDLKVRITNGIGEISLKYGNWHDSASREEYGLPFDVNGIENILGMVKRLEHQWGIITSLHRVEYDYQGMTITVDDYHEFDQDVLEVEALVDKKSDLEMAENKVDKFLREQNLEALDSATMQKLVAEMNAREEWRFDFSKQGIHEFVEKWKDYILCKI